MQKGNKIITKADVKHVEVLLSSGIKLELIAEIIGTSRTTVRRIRDGKHYLQKTCDETPEPIEEITPAVSLEQSSEREVTLLDIVKNQEQIIQLLHDYLAEWRLA